MGNEGTHGEASVGDNRESDEASNHDRMPYWRYICDQSWMSSTALNWDYDGSGTEDDPYVVTWPDKDRRNPLNFGKTNKWCITLLVAIITLAAAFGSSAYSGCFDQVIQTFGISEEVASVGLSLYVVGFALGPLLWAPMSELYGRQVILFISYGGLTAFNAGAAGARNIETLLILRFFAGAFSASALTNSGGVIGDMFDAKDRGMAMGLFAMAPFMGPVLGPVVGGFLGQSEGWRWVEGLMAIFSGVLWLLGAAFVPETYAPLLLRKRADKLRGLTGKVYRSHYERNKTATTAASTTFQTVLFRPWSLLFHEPIVLFLSVWMSIVYGTLYMLFGAFPIVYQEKRGWNEGQGGLAFLGVLVGIVLGVLANVPEDRRYQREVERRGGIAPPEQRLPLAMVGGVAVPVGLIWFAWTNSPDIHVSCLSFPGDYYSTDFVAQWMASVAAAVPFGFGMVLIFITIKNYLVDAYTIYGASALAVTVVLRSLFGAAFPLFTTAMYHNLGIHWASMLTAFLSLMCTPLPFICYVYGARMRAKCRYALESEEMMAKMHARQQEQRQKTEERSREHEEQA
jgi:multidrug resistance protein